MDSSTTRRGLTSLGWFLASHADDLPADIPWALGDLSEVQEREAGELIHRIRELSHGQLEQLCSAIQSVHRSYFGTMNGRELSSFLHQVVIDDSLAWH
jgi:hypothetical protein